MSGRSEGLGSILEPHSQIQLGTEAAGLIVEGDGLAIVACPPACADLSVWYIERLDAVELSDVSA
jgi:hypothetical protein